MNTYKSILLKLNEFIQKHYGQKLVKGVLLFLAFGLLFFIVVMGVEYLLWLNSTGRLILLVLFIAVELFLLFTYIITPLFYLFKVKRGISLKDAAKMIGKHFPNVEDKLYNLLDLADNSEQTELLLASIEQRSQELNPIPFSSAITYKDAFKYAKYAIIPLLIAGVVYFSGNWKSFFGSYERVVNYDLAYEPPAPFVFELLSSNLQVIESEQFTFKVATHGEIKPENIYLVLDGKEILLQEEKGVYQYTMSPPIRSGSFSFRANDVRSREYNIEALKAPAIVDFELVLDYPSYLKKKSETVKSTGNALLPEGTKVTWNIKGQDTQNIHLITADTTLSFNKEIDAFSLSKSIFNDFPYQLTTSNENTANYEKLDYSFKVIKDGFPNIKVTQVLDSLEPNIAYYSGEATDDYGLKHITLVYYEQGKEAAGKSITIATPNNNFNQFYYTYPSGLEVEAGKTYDYYFLATDNDGLRRGKSTKSQVFSSVLLNDNQLKNKDLKSQQDLINNLDKSLEKVKEQKDALQELNKEQKEKNSLNFNDKNQVKDFLQKQERQEALMQKFSKELKENLNKSNKDDKLNQLLQERLERQELEAKKNQKLLEELNKIAEKINKEELVKRLEELGKNQQNSERSLEQLLELTKRYYVTEKAAQLAADLKALSEKQQELSETPTPKETNPKEQETLNKAFDKIAQELDELKKDNAALKKPLDLQINDTKKEGVKENQAKALEEIQKLPENSNNTAQKEKAASDAKKNQKAAADKMKEMSEELGESSSSGGGGSSISEDAEMLRQILDNLIIFSFKQEALFNQLGERQDEDPSQYAKTVRNQKELRNLFEHVDDSLFSLSLRQAELSEFVNEQITEVYYNIDKSLESMADGRIYQGVSYQQYVLTASNSLADFLAKVMDNMNDSMKMGKGQGASQGGFQLPDIIKAQESLGEKMGKSGKDGQSGENGKGKQGQQGAAGEKGSGQKGEGKQGQGGQQGEGKQGEGGQQGQGKGGEAGEGQNGEGKNGSNPGNGQGNGGSGTEGLSESELKEIYEIYQEQQRLRQELEQQLENMINSGDRKLGEKLVRQMEDFENDLLENGITQRTINKVNTIQYELLKLENAALKQGQKPERESNVNSKDFSNPITTKPSLLDNYRNEVELLNRQALPLRQNFQNKVKVYFKGDD